MGFSISSQTGLVARRDESRNANQSQVDNRAHRTSAHKLTLQTLQTTYCVMSCEHCSVTYALVAVWANSVFGTEYKYYLGSDFCPIQIQTLFGDFEDFEDGDPASLWTGSYVNALVPRFSQPKRSLHNDDRFYEYDEDHKVSTHQTVFETSLLIFLFFSLSWLWRLQGWWHCHWHLTWS